MSESHAAKRKGETPSTDAISPLPEPCVTIDSEVTRRIRQHARANPRTEVCGVLIGDDVNNTIEIRASIEALNAAQAGTHVTFTQDAWEEIYRIKDEHYPNERIVGWYHSHPGFGVFLSEHDMFIQQNFFSSPGQVAWVYDPYTDEEGCFGWVSGEVHRLSTLSIADRNGDGVERTPKPIESSLAVSDPEDGMQDESLAQKTKPRAAWVRALVTLFTHVTVLLVGFAIAYLFFPRVLALMIDPMTGEVIVRDGRVLLPYLNGRVPMPSTTPPPTSAPPPAATAPVSPAKPQAAPPAKPSTAGSHQ
jgi:proteasome lid subunit RPN8/RPN11